MMEKVVEMTKTREILKIKNSDLEAMQKPQVRMVKGEADMSPGSLEWIASCRDLPTEFAFELNKLRLLIKNVVDAYNPLKQALIEKDADRDEKGELTQTAPNIFSFTTNAQHFREEFNKLLDLESKLDCEKLKINLKDIPDKFLSANDFTSLKCIINFTKEKEDG